MMLKKSQLKDHDVFEFQKGHFTGSHWLDSSIYIDDDLFRTSDLFELFSFVVNFSYDGVTEINSSQWDMIKERASSCTLKITQNIISEIDHWAKDCFRTEVCFTICGL